MTAANKTLGQGALAALLTVVCAAQAAPGAQSSAFAANPPETVVEVFSDFQCPFCQQFAPAVRELQSKGIEGLNVRVVFKNFPLNFHPNAQLAAQAAAAAKEQGKFWEMHDLLFANQGALSRADLLKYARSLKLDMTRFEKDMDSDAIKKQIQADLLEGSARKVEGTPTFFVNGTAYSGTRTAQELRTLAAGDILRKMALAEIPDERMSKGPREAPVTVEFFADLESPVTQPAVAVLNNLMSRYPAAVRLQFRNFPLSFHPQAGLVHEAAMAAAKEGRFWEMVGFVLARQGAVREPELIAQAGSLGMDQGKFAESLQKRKYSARVEADVEEGLSRGLRGSPVIIVNGRRIDGVPNPKTLAEYVEAALAPKTK